MTSNLQTLINNEIASFEKESKRLFTHPEGGLSVLLDYPPHERVLDNKMVESFLRSMATRIAHATADGLMVEKKESWDGKGLPYENSIAIYGNARIEAYRKGYNSALTAIAQKRDEFFNV